MIYVARPKKWYMHKQKNIVSDSVKLVGVRSPSVPYFFHKRPLAFNTLLPNIIEPTK